MVLKPHDWLPCYKETLIIASRKLEKEEVEEDKVERSGVVPYLPENRIAY